MRKGLAWLLILVMVCAFSSAGAELTERQIAGATDYFSHMFEAAEIMGGGVLVSQKGQRIFDCFYGYGNLAHDRAVDEDTVYKVASVSKFVAAIGLMQLVEQGKIDLDAPLRSDSGRPIENPYHPGEPVTMRQCLSHTSSFDADAPYFGYLQWDLIDTDDNGFFTYAHPGDKYVYSNLNGGMINSMIELVSGENFIFYMRDHVFAPLGLNAAYAAHLLPDTSTISNTYRADGIVYRSARQFLEDDEWDFDPSVSPYSHYSVAAGALYISLAGLETIGQMLANMGEVHGVRILGEDTVRLMMADQSALPGSTVSGDSPYGLCVCRDQVGDTVWYGHQGRLEGLLIDVFMEPQTQTVVVFVMNGVGGTNGREVSDRAEMALSYVEPWVKAAQAENSGD